MHMHMHMHMATPMHMHMRRYVLEDVPYGLVVIAQLGELVGRTAVLHRAGIALFSALYGRDFDSENELLTAIGFGRMSLDELRAAVRGEP